MKEKKFIVITGAAGFIGSASVSYLNEQGKSNLILIDDLKSDEKWKNLVGKSFEDIIPISKAFNFLENNIENVQAVIHLGACCDTVESNVDYLLDANYRFSILLAKTLIHRNIRFIYASSAATYGDGGEGFHDDHAKLEKLRPLNPYGYSKHIFDLWLKRNNLLGNVVGLKYFNVFGPNEYHKGRMASAIFHFARQIQREGKIKLFKSNNSLYKDGEQKRDFIYVKDVVKMTCKFLDEYLEVSGIFNIGSGIASTWNEVAKHLFKAFDKPCIIEYIPLPEDLKNQYQNYTCADMQKYHNLGSLKFKATTLESAIGDYVNSYLKRDGRW